MSLSERQKKLLEAIINEFLETAHAVGSLTLSDKYELGVSPATLRSEMSRLVSEGYLEKEHASSGRIPTALGIRYFIDKLLEEDDIEKLQEIQLREQIYQKRFNQYNFVKEAVKILSELCNEVALVLLDDTLQIYGLCQLLTMPEFEDIEYLRNVLNILESEHVLISLIQKYGKDTGLTVLVGDEHGIKALERCTIVFSRFNYYRGKKGYIGILGPYRMDYSHILPSVRFVTDFMNQAITGWQ